MRIIYKYPLEKDYPHTHIEAPIDRILSIQIQNGIPCLWARVNTENCNRILDVYCFGTGMELDGFINRHPNIQYLSTVQQPPLVWHYYYEFVEKRLEE